jgi:hypothetical protein
VPTTYWFKNNAVVNYSQDFYLFQTGYGDAGFYVIKAEITDGELNDSVEWNVTVISKSQPGGGGGGGGGGCSERWVCDDWFDCASLSELFANASKQAYYAWEKIWTTGCEADNISLYKCGLQIRHCEDIMNCSSLLGRPTEYQICVLKPTPSCDDGIRNCHHMSCEVLIDCGGPCKPCPGEGITEYPKSAAYCGDKKCSINEIFSCIDDCYLFWLLWFIAIIIIVTVIYMVKKKRLEANIMEIQLEEEKKRTRIEEEIEDLKQYMSRKKIEKAFVILKKTIKLVEDVKDSKERIKLRKRLFRLEKELQSTKK